MVLEKRNSNALTPLSYIVFSSDYFFQSFCNIWVSLTPSDNSFTISPHNLALLHSTLLHSYPVPHQSTVMFGYDIFTYSISQFASVQVKSSTRTQFTPPPPTRMHEGAACAFPFSWERGCCLAVCLGKIFPRKPGKGGIFKPSSRDMGYFSDAFREIRKRGYD